MDDFTALEDTNVEAQPSAPKRRRTAQEDGFEDMINPLDEHLPSEILADTNDMKTDFIDKIKKLKILHPDLDLSALIEMDKELQKKSLRELQKEYENMRLAIGLTKPGDSAVGIVGGVGVILGRLTGQADLHHRLVRNKEILCGVDEMFSSYFQYFAPPMKLAYLIGQSILDNGIRPPE